MPPELPEPELPLVVPAVPAVLAPALSAASLMALSAAVFAALAASRAARAASRAALSALLRDDFLLLVSPVASDTVLESPPAELPGVKLRVDDEPEPELASPVPEFDGQPATSKLKQAYRPIRVTRYVPAGTAGGEASGAGLRIVASDSRSLEMGGVQLRLLEPVC